MSVREVYKLSEEEKAKFLEKETQILSNAEKYDYYEDYISTQKKPFLDFMNYLNNWINQQKAEGLISDYVELRARIKAPSSALKNDSDKALDDAFGMELICATDQEIKYLLNELSNFMYNSTKSKSYNKKNGYKAEHRYLTLKQECYNLLYPNMDNDSQDLLSSQVPLIEFQLKTIEIDIIANLGSADHTAYKGSSRDDIQELYNKGELKVGQNLPRMWCSENGTMKLLSDERTAKKLYPFLNITNTLEKTITD